MHKPALISLTFDDGLRCQFEQAVPILGQHGFPATFFLLANVQAKHENKYPKIEWHERDISMLKEMARRGHEIGSHTINHCSPTMQNSEAHESKRWMEERMGAVEIPSFAYPFYTNNGAIKNAVIHAGYKQARTGPSGFYYASPDSVDWFAVDSRQIARTGEIVNTWVNPGCWYVLTFHGIGDEREGWEPITVAEFIRQMAELAKLRDSGDVEVVTFKEGADRLRQ
jgi:peptidoglycan/xylan/chitin deacetylase (PgdA/CDA1 family)